MCDCIAHMGGGTTRLYTCFFLCRREETRGAGLIFQRDCPTIGCVLSAVIPGKQSPQHSTVFGNNIQIGAIFCSREETLPCGNCNSKTSSGAVRVEAIYMKWSKKCTNMSGNKLRNRSIPAFQGNLRSFELVSNVVKIWKIPRNLAWNCSASSCGE